MKNIFVTGKTPQPRLLKSTKKSHEINQKLLISEKNIHFRDVSGITNLIQLALTVEAFFS